MTHTKEPWFSKFDGGRNQYVVHDAQGQVVAIVGGTEMSETIANAHILAAAPELLEALAELTTALRTMEKPWHSGMPLYQIEDAERAIAKAETAPQPADTDASKARMKVKRSGHSA